MVSRRLTSVVEASDKLLQFAGDAVEVVRGVACLGGGGRGGACWLRDVVDAAGDLVASGGDLRDATVALVGGGQLLLDGAGNAGLTAADLRDDLLDLSDRFAGGDSLGP